MTEDDAMDHNETIQEEDPYGQQQDTDNRHYGEEAEEEEQEQDQEEDEEEEHEDEGEEEE